MPSQSLVSTVTSAAVSRSATSDRLPRKRTRPSSPSSWARRSSAGRRLPSPASHSTASRATMAQASSSTSWRFCGSILARHSATGTSSGTPSAARTVYRSTRGVCGNAALRITAGLLSPASHSRSAVAAATVTTESDVRRSTLAALV